VRPAQFGRTTPPSRESILRGTIGAVGEARRIGGDTGRTAADQFLRIGQLVLKEDRTFGTLAARVASGEIPLERAIEVTRELAKAERTEKAAPKLKLPTNADQLIILKHTDKETGEIDFDAALPELEARQIRQKLATQKASKEEPENFFIVDANGNATGLAAGITGKDKFAARKSIQIRIDNADKNISEASTAGFIATEREKAEFIAKWQEKRDRQQTFMDVLNRSSVQPKVKAPKGKKSKFEVLSVE
jgi:hypothetical protein